MKNAETQQIIQVFAIAKAWKLNLAIGFLLSTQGIDQFRVIKS
jgi:hypothetical protein